MSASTFVGQRADKQQDPREWLVLQMRGQPPRLDAGTIVSCLPLHDLVRLADLAERLWPGQDLLRGPVISLAATCLEPNAEGAPRPRAGDERRVALLIQLGRVTQRQRTEAIKERWHKLGLTDRQVRVIRYMPGQSRHRLGFVKWVFDELRGAPWLSASVSGMYLQGTPATCVSVDAGESQKFVEVEVDVAVDIPPVGTEIPDVEGADVLGVSVIFPAAGKQELCWNLEDGGAAILKEAHSVRSSCRKERDGKE